VRTRCACSKVRIALCAAVTSFRDLVAQNYLRAETVSTANGRLIDAQASIGTAQVWGGGLVASVDGLRFVVPFRPLDVILNRDGGPAPEMIATDTASYSDIVFGLFRAHSLPTIEENSIQSS